jgi:hypothetical protein
MKLSLGQSVGASFSALLTSSATLVCCVLPAVFVSLGAGATLAGLVSTFPQLIWMSEHKGLIFGVAGAMLLFSGAMVWRARSLPCPSEPAAAHACNRLRRLSQHLLIAAISLYLVGVVFAFALPLL